MSESTDNMDTHYRNFFVVNRTIGALDDPSLDIPTTITSNGTEMNTGESVVVSSSDDHYLPSGASEIGAHVQLLALQCHMS